MGLHSRSSPRIPSYLLFSVVVLAFLSFTILLVYMVDDFVTQTKTIAGHNLEPTPWHLFPPKTFSEESRQARTYKIIHCSYLACRYGSNSPPQPLLRPNRSPRAPKCPKFFRWIHHDLEPWTQTRVAMSHLMEAQKSAAFRAVIVGGRLYVDMYYACVQSRAMFTIWGLLQLLRRYSGMVPDVDLMFDCMDKPIINRTEHNSMPLPLFRYCTTEDHFDIPFPDWSFWGWLETNIRPWEEEFQDIKKGSERLSWYEKAPYAFWKGNPDVFSSVRTELLKCNDSTMWGAQIMRQDWVEEAKGGYETSKLSNQCKNKYKIYAEGYAWSVSLKYILSCGSMPLIISPKYEDFFSRGLFPKKNYWPIPFSDSMCDAIKYAVDWGNEHTPQAKAIGKAAQEFTERLNMDQVYDYMFHLVSEYAKLQDFKPVPPRSALEVCVDSLLCIADEQQRKLLEKSRASPSPSSPCTLQPANPRLLENWRLQKMKKVKKIEEDSKHKEPI